VFIDRNVSNYTPFHFATNYIPFISPIVNGASPPSSPPLEAPAIRPRMSSSLAAGENWAAHGPAAVSFWKSMST
jgi:hypothetical protein